LIHERVRMKSVLIIEDNKEIALQMEKYLIVIKAIAGIIEQL